MSYPNVSYEEVEKAVPCGADLSLVHRATEKLAEIMGEWFSKARVEWSTSRQEDVGLVYSVRLEMPEWESGQHVSTLSADEIANKYQLTIALARLWGRILKQYDHRLIREFAIHGE